MEEEHVERQNVIVMYNAGGDLSSSPSSLSEDPQDVLFQSYNKSNQKTKDQQACARSQLFPTLDQSIIQQMIHSEKSYDNATSISNSFFINHI